MVNEEDKIYRVSSSTAQQFEAFRSKLIQSGILNENSSAKELMDQIAMRLTDANSESDVSDASKVEEDLKNASVQISDQKIE